MNPGNSQPGRYNEIQNKIYIYTHDTAYTIILGLSHDHNLTMKREEADQNMDPIDLTELHVSSPSFKWCNVQSGAIET